MKNLNRFLIELWSLNSIIILLVICLCFASCETKNKYFEYELTLYQNSITDYSSKYNSKTAIYELTQRNMDFLDIDTSSTKFQGKIVLSKVQEKKIEMLYDSLSIKCTSLSVFDKGQLILNKKLQFQITKKNITCQEEKDKESFNFLYNYISNQIKSSNEYKKIHSWEFSHR